MIRQLFVVAMIAIGLGVLCGAVTPAFACGAEGGDNRDPAANCAARASSHPAVHAGASPGSSTAFPVDIITGNKFFAQLDARLPGGLSLTRFYNSRHLFKGHLGVGWRHAFHVSLSVKIRKDHVASAQIVQGDGRRIVFRAQSSTDTSNLRALHWAYGAIIKEPDLAPDRRWRWQWRDGSRLYFSARGRLTAVEKSAGERLHLTYSGDPLRLQTVSNRHRQVLKFNYSPGPERLLRSVQLPDGQLVEYQYDPQHLLTDVRRDDSPQWAFEHDDAHLGAIVTVRNALGDAVNHMKYGPQRRIVHSALAGGSHAMTLAYQIPLTPAESGETRITFGQQKLVTRYAWRYNPVTQQRSLISARGSACAACPPIGIRRNFDQQGRLASVSRPGGSRSVRVYDTLGRLAEYQWSRANHKPGQTSQPQIKTTIQYQSDRAGALIRQLSRPSLAPGKTHRLSLTRDSLNRIVTLDETGYEPDLKTLIWRRSHWEIGRWKELHRQWQIRYVDFGAAAGLIAQIDGPVPGSGDLVRYRYDQAGRRVAQVGPYRNLRRWSYHSNGLISATASTEGASEQFTYDRFNRLVGHIRDGITSVITRDAVGRRVNLKTSNRPGVALSRDANGVMTGLSDPHGNRIALLQKAGASGSGSITRSADQLPRVIQQLLPKSALGFSTRVSPPGTEFELDLRDDFGRVVAQFDSATGTQRTVFDLADRPIARVGSREVIDLYKYEASGRFSGMLSSNGNAWSQRWHRGRVISRSSPVEQTAYQYNQNRQIVLTSTHYADKALAQQFKSPLVLKRQYDRHGRLTHREIGHGWRLNYRWRDTNELGSISLVQPATDSAPASRVPLADNLVWQPFGDGRSGLLSARLGNDIQSKVSLSNTLRITSIGLRKLSPGKPNRRSLPEVRLQYDLSGKVVGQEVGDTRFSYQYNEQGWLTGYQSGLAQEAWRYRPDGKRQAVRSANKPSLIKTAGARHNTSPHWVKPAAKLIQSPTGAAVLLNRAARPQYATTRNGRVYRYVYNISGVRIGKLSIDRPKTSRWFVYENKRLLMETDADGSPLRVFIRLDDKPLAVIDFSSGARTPTINWIHTDAVGQPVAATNATGEVTWTGTFSPFGRYLGGADSVPPPAWLPLRLPGQYYDEETGFHDNFRRTYNPKTGAYLGPDPLGIRPRSLRYAYAGNSPLDTIDPLGLYELDMHYYATFAIALAAGMNYDDARTVANANQHVDDHIDTEPIVRREDGTTDLIETALRRADVLRQWHFVLETPVQNADGTVSYQTSTDTRISNPDSPRLRTLRRWVDGAESRMTQMFRLGAYSHSYMDTAAHRYPDNRPIPASVTVVGLDGNLAVGHGPHFHYPDYTYNTCPEEFPGGELPSSDPDRDSGLQEWPNNEARTLTIQQDIYELYREFSNGPARVSWEQLELVLAQFNAVQEQGDPDNPSAADFPEKLALLEEMLANAGVLNTTTGVAVDFSGREGGSGENSYNRRQATLEWAERFSDPNEFVESGVQ